MISILHSTVCNNSATGFKAGKSSRYHVCIEFYSVVNMLA